MSRKWKRVAWGVVAGAVAGFLALNLLAYNHARGMTRYSTGGPRTAPAQKLSRWGRVRTLLTGVNLPRPKADNPHPDLGRPGQSVRIPCPDGPVLGAWYCPAPTNQCLVLLFHGYGGEKTSLAAEAREFLELGCSVMLVDFRGSGESTEDYTTIGYREGIDVAAAVALARERFPHARMVLYGSSMGAASVLRAVSAQGVRPDGIILEAVFDTLLTTVRNRFHVMKTPSFPAAELLVFWGGRQQGFDGFAHNPVEYARSVKCPALVLQGGQDPLAGLEAGRAVAAAVPGTGRFAEFPAAGHEPTLAVAPAQWRAAVVDLLADAARASAR